MSLHFAYPAHAHSARIPEVPGHLFAQVPGVEQDPEEVPPVNHSTPLKARPTTYKGIEMRSRTEAAYAAHLDAAGITWEYEPRCFADETRQYLPDFLILDLRYPTYVEVKGAHPPKEEVEAIKKRMEVIWASEPDAFLMLVVTSTGDVFHADGAQEDEFHHTGVRHEWFHQNPNAWSGA